MLKCVTPSCPKLNEVSALTVQFASILLIELANITVKNLFAVAVDGFQSRFQFGLMRMNKGVNTPLNSLETLRVIVTADHVRSFNNYQGSSGDVR